MKKLLVFGLATLLVIAFCIPAHALENVFGGYWRVRGFTNKEFDGQDDGTRDETRTDTRTRLYYTAILNDNLKFVNKFEFDAVFGEQGGYGDYGADGVSVEVKNTYADFNLGPTAWKLGVFGSAIGRSLVFDNDHSGAEIVYRGSDNKWWLRGRWLKAYEGGKGTSRNKEDYDAVALESMFRLGEAGEVRPYVVYSWSKQFVGGDDITGVSNFLPEGNDANIWWLGLDTDLTLGPVALYASVAGSLGSIDGDRFDRTVGDDGKTDQRGFKSDDIDLKGYVVLLGADVPLGPATIHAQGFYASGDASDPTEDLENAGDINGYVGLSDSYYWSEILGFGIFDQDAPLGSPADKLNNIWALNLGASIKPFDKLTIRGDLWYAEKPEEVQYFDEDGDETSEEDELGVEANLKITYELVEGMNLDLVGAYLWAGDAVSTDGDNDEDPYEVGFRTSLSF